MEVTKFSATELAREMMRKTQEVIDSLPAMAKQAKEASGLVYELYVISLSDMVDRAVAYLTPVEQEAVRQIARETVDYASPSEIAAMEEGAAGQGLCQHFLDEQTCPCGCFEFEHGEDCESDEPKVPALEHRYLEVIRQRGWEAQAEILRVVEPIYRELFQAPSGCVIEGPYLAYHDSRSELRRIEALLASL